LSIKFVQVLNILREEVLFPSLGYGAGISPLAGVCLTLRFLPQYRLEALLDALLQQRLVGS
jgi:hypothetical protein